MNIAIEYKAIKALGLSNFNEEVNIAIGEGWQPIGGMSSTAIMKNTVHGEEPTIYFYQALVKYEN